MTPSLDSSFTLVRLLNVFSLVSAKALFEFYRGRLTLYPSTNSNGS